jgi:predicted nucleic acid-binding protein
VRFLDTNILLYRISNDPAEKEKARVAEEILRQTDLGLSVQVLQEFYVNVTAKISKPISPAQARTIISRYRVWPLEENNADSILRASEIQEHFRLSFWDALIIAAAIKATRVFPLPTSPSNILFIGLSESTSSSIV